MAKYKLESDPLPDVFLIAISSHVHDYRLCWALNKSLGIGLGRRRAHIGAGPQGDGFTAFDHLEEETQAMVSLVSNHAPEGVLVAEQRQADYFLLVEQESSLRPGETLARVRQAEFVLAAYPLELKNIKSAYRLVE